MCKHTCYWEHTDWNTAVSSPVQAGGVSTSHQTGRSLSSSHTYEKLGLLRRKNMNDIDKAKQLINDFCLREYKEEANFDNLAKVSIAYTETEDTNLPLQVVVNLETFCLDQYLDNKLIGRNQYNNLNEFITEKLQYLNFSELMKIPAQPKPLVGFISYLGCNGIVGDRRQYADAKQFYKDVESSAYYGEPISVTLYKDKNGKAIDVQPIFDIEAFIHIGYQQLDTAIF